MRQTGYILLLLLLWSCASRQAVRHAGRTADVRPALPAAAVREVEPSQAEPVQEEAEPVRSAKPLVAQVQRAPAGTWQAAKQQALDSLCQAPLFETSQLGLYVYDLTAEEPLYAVNAAHRMRPASCQKVVTAVTALHFLGGDYQLRTEFRLTGKVAGGTLQGDLRVVGGMDPLVTTDELLQAAATLRRQAGIDSIAGAVVLDTSMREDTPMGWGWCWDDDYGPLSALMVDGKAVFEQKWSEAMEKAGIRTTSASSLKGEKQKASTGGASAGSVAFTIRHGVDQLLLPMMKESNNIFAECLFYQTAASTGKKGAGHKQAAQRTDELLRRIGLDPSPYKVADGSGLSLYDYASAEMLVALLGHAWRTESIRGHLLASLPVAGVDGTLQKRMKGTQAEGNVRAKTGTVTGIVSLCGFLTAANGHTLAFAIINQGIQSSAMGRTWQDKVCQELCR